MAAKPPNKQALSKNEAIVQGLQACYKIGVPIIKAVLEANNGHFEKSMKALDFLSNQKKQENIQQRGKKKKKSNNLEQKSNPVKPNDSKVITAPGAKSKGSTTKKTKAASANNTVDNKATPVNNQKFVKKNNPPKATKSSNDDDSWIIVNMAKTGAIPKTKVKNKESPKPKDSFPQRDIINVPSNAAPMIRDEANEERKKKRAVLKSNFDIIKQKSDPVNRIRDYIKFEIKVLILMRGCPGSGKSTFAQEILRTNGIVNVNDHIFSTDNYFGRSGQYIFNPDLLSEAHNWNKDVVEKVMKLGLSPVIVDNTNVKAWEMEPYVQFAVRLGYVIETVEPRTPWFFNESILAKKNSHGVNKWKIEQMLSSYEANLTGETLLNNFKLSYNVAQIPPQVVSYNMDAVKKVLNKFGSQVKTLPKSVAKVPVPKPVQNSANEDLLFPAKPHSSLFLETVSKSKNAAPVRKKRTADDKSRVGENESIIDRPMDDVLGGPLLQPQTFEPNPKPSAPTLSNFGYWTTDLLNSLSNLNDLDSGAPASSEKLQKSVEEDDDTELECNFRRLVELFPNIQPEYLRKVFSHCQSDMDLTISTLFDPSHPFKPDDYLIKNEDEKDDDSSDDEEESGIDGENEDSSEESCDESSGESVEEDIKVFTQLFPNIDLEVIKKTFNSSGGNINLTLHSLMSIQKENEKLEKVGEKIEESRESELKADQDSIAPLNMTEPEKTSLDSVPKVDSFDESTGFCLAVENEEVAKTSDAEDAVKCLLGDSKKPGSEGESSDLSVSKVESDKAPGKNDSDSFTLEEGRTESASLNEDAQLGKSGKYSGFISLNNFKEAMSNVLSSLGAISIEKSGSPGNEVLDGSGLLSSESPSSSEPSKEKSELVANLLSWNKGTSNPTLLTSQFDTIPKVQRERFQSDAQEESGRTNSSTNTNYKDFELLKSSISSGNILFGSPNFQSRNNCSVVKRKVLMFDKGTFTEELEMNYFCPTNSSLLILEGMFPTVPKDDLSELLTSCGGDVNWVVGLLLDSGLEVSSQFNPPENLLVSEPPGVSNSEAHVEPETPKCEPKALSAKSKKKKSPNTSTHSMADTIKLNFFMNSDSDSSNLRKVRNMKYKTEASPPVPDVFDPPVSPIPVEDLSDSEEGDLSLPIGTDLVKELQAQFGGLLPNKLEDGKVIVNMPVQLARQLHSYIMDSLYQEFEEEEMALKNMISEDECLAQRLHEVENGTQESQPSLQEIMDKELALSLHKSLNRDSEKGNTIASKLSEQLLIERFPRMDPTTLKAILEDTDHSLYQATHLLEAAGFSSASVDPSPNNLAQAQDGVISREEAVQQANAYREAANVLIDLRKDCLAKAEKAYSEGMKSVASYYSQMARWHNERIEQANLLASTILLDGNKDATTLDLHFLRVREALMVLDLFLDAHIRNLIEMKVRKREVYIITGRGVHSTDGKSKIKPVVLNRLRQRNVVFRAVNPGLFMVTINPKTALTCDN